MEKIQNISAISCCGCGACLSSCPVKCINLHEGREGFWIATVNDSCIHCGKCLSVCSQQFRPDDCKRPLTAYMAFNKDDSICNVSTSGGVFSAISRYFIDNGGAVYGAVFDETFRVHHMRATHFEEIGRLRGTRYVQSNAFESFPMIHKDLEQGKKVLFVGTPCQIYALNVYLGTTYQNLFTADLICHGVPSPTLFRGYLRFLQRKHHGTITEYHFRSEEHANSIISYISKVRLKKTNGKEETMFLDGDEDPYIISFLSNRLQCKACFQCRFTSLDRQGDLTMGDYWGYSEAHPEYASKQGVSLVLVNSAKGAALLKTCADTLCMIDTNEEEYLKRNHHLQAPPNMSEDRDRLYAAFTKKGFNRSFYRLYFLPKGYGRFLMKRRLLKLFHFNRNPQK